MKKYFFKIPWPQRSKFLLKKLNISKGSGTFLRQNVSFFIIKAIDLRYKTASNRYESEIHKLSPGADLGWTKSLYLADDLTFTSDLFLCYQSCHFFTWRLLFKIKMSLNLSLFLKLLLVFVFLFFQWETCNRCTNCGCSSPIRTDGRRTPL